MPEIATIAEGGKTVGLGRFDIDTWFGLFGPAKMAPEVTQRLNRAFVDGAQHPRHQGPLATLLAEPAPMTPEQFAGFVKGELAKYQNLVKTTGARVE